MMMVGWREKKKVRRIRERVREKKKRKGFRRGSFGISILIACQMEFDFRD